MHALPVFQRAVVGIAALGVALRVFSPITTPGGPFSSSKVLIAPTLLQIVGIVVLAGAVLILFPSPTWTGFRQWAGTGGLIAGWLAYVALAILVVQGGVINSRVSAFLGGALLILAAPTCLWTLSRKRKALTALTKGLAALILVVGISLVTLIVMLPVNTSPVKPVVPWETSPAEAICYAKYYGWIKALDPGKKDAAGTRKSMADNQNDLRECLRTSGAPIPRWLATIPAGFTLDVSGPEAECYLRYYRLWTDSTKFIPDSAKSDLRVCLEKAKAPVPNWVSGEGYR